MEKMYRRFRGEVDGPRAFSGYMRVSSNPRPRSDTLSSGSSYKGPLIRHETERGVCDFSRGHLSSPSTSYSRDAPVECSRSRSRRHSQGSSSMKPPSCSPFEAFPRTLKNSPPSPELASSSSCPHQVTNAGSWHPAGDLATNPLHSSREDCHSCWQPSHDPSLTSTRYPRPGEPSVSPSNLSPRLESPSKPPSKPLSRLETCSKSPSHLELPRGSSFLLREALTSMSKPAPTSFESRSRVSRGFPPLRESRSSSEPSPSCREASRDQVPPQRFSFCFFCGHEGHIRAKCKVCASYLAAGRCRLVRGRVVLPTGEEIPREALGRTLQARLDFWALARGPGSFVDKVSPPPSSLKAVLPLSSPRVNPETTPKHLASSRAAQSPSKASQPPSKVSQAPSSTSETLDRKPRALEVSPSHIPRLVRASRRSPSPSPVPLGRAPPPSRIPRPVKPRGRSRLRPSLCSRSTQLRGQSLAPPHSPSMSLWLPLVQALMQVLAQYHLRDHRDYPRTPSRLSRDP
ncbi:hypothetical protein BKA83DRAFT_4299786 [Pisolithus microcarpus]|nr:hypothetical protein BKA83DRAFT_4299786 [Pisolithus microcarpus]